MRYRLIDIKKRRFVGSLEELKPLSVYCYNWFDDITYLFLQRQTKKGSKWKDCKLPISWYILQNTKFMNDFHIVEFEAGHF